MLMPGRAPIRGCPSLVEIAAAQIGSGRVALCLSIRTALSPAPP